MSVDLSLIIADLENKIAAADSNTPVLDLLQMVTAAERLTGGKNVYDSAGVLPTGNEYIGTIAMTADGTIRVYSGESGGWDTLDSSSYTAPISYTFQGSSYGYTSGGSNPPVNTNIIDKFPFSTDANATDVGDLTRAGWITAGQSSSTYGYATTGYIPTLSPAYNDAIDKFSFTSDGNSTSTTTLSEAGYQGTGNSSSTHGYTSGRTNPITPPGYKNTIDKFPFSVDTNATDVGDLTNIKSNPSGQSSTSNGYTAGGRDNAMLNIIDKFPFSTDANATDVGDLLATNTGPVGQSSTDNGYVSGGISPTSSPAYINVIQKFPFSIDANSTDVGDLSITRYGGDGQSSTTNGYTSGGGLDPATPGISNVIDKFPFSTDANATDVGDLTAARYYASGQQV